MTRRWLKRWLTRTTLAAIAIAVAVSVATASGAGTKSGGTFRLGTSSRIDSLNPFVAFNQDAYSTFMYIYPALVQYDRTNLQFAPDFAKSWQVSKDGKTWTFKTVPGATWTDGQRGRSTRPSGTRTRAPRTTRG
jgi:peptide/nickel transport system substrate-binding protein